MSRIKLFFLFLTVAALLISSPFIAKASLLPPTVSAHHAILMDGNSLDVLWEKDADAPVPMASTTKIMTALVVLDCLSPETVVTVSPLAVGIEGTSAYLKEGEVLTVNDLLHALLLQSANDAAMALAIACDGTEDAFVKRMNQKAEELNLKQTHFENPHGLHVKTHFTTAKDLSMLASYAMHRPAFAQIVAKKSYTCQSSLTTRTFSNHNKLLRLSGDAVGIKTGFTKDSGRCLVGAAQKDGTLLITVTLRAGNDWQDHLALWRYGLSLLGCE